MFSSLVFLPALERLNSKPKGEWPQMYKPEVQKEYFGKGSAADQDGSCPKFGRGLFCV